MNKKKLKHLVISTFYALVNPFRKLYWFIFRPISLGVKTVIFYNDKVLLVKPSYGHKRWSLPGGGVKRNESFEEAARREIFEEVGLQLNDVHFFYEFHNNWQYRKNIVQCFTTQVSSGHFTIDEQEISEAGWFSPSSLPENVRPSATDVLLKYNEWKKNHA